MTKIELPKCMINVQSKELFRKIHPGAYSTLRSVRTSRLISINFNLKLMLIKLIQISKLSHLKVVLPQYID